MGPTKSSGLNQLQLLNSIPVEVCLPSLSWSSLCGFLQEQRCAGVSGHSVYRSARIQCVHKCAVQFAGGDPDAPRVTYGCSAAESVQENAAAKLHQGKNF